MRAFAAKLLALLLPTLAPAATLRDCDTWEANARHLIFPVEENTATYANGRVALIGLDIGGEPVCCSAHLMVLYPSAEEGFRQCTLVSDDSARGWAGVDVGNARSAYDPATGLRLSVPVSIYNGAGTDPAVIDITVNQSTGTVTAE